VLFTLAPFGGLSHRCAHSHAGNQHGSAGQLFDQSAGSVLGIFDLFSGGQLPPPDDFRPRHHAVHHLLHHPAANDRGVSVSERLQKEGELGRRKITQYTRYLTIVLSIIQSFTIAQTLQAASGPGGQSMSITPDLVLR